MDERTKKAERIYNILLHELQLGDLLKDVEVRTTVDPDMSFTTTTTDMIDYWTKRAEQAYEKAGKPPLKARDECIQILDNYTIN